MGYDQIAGVIYTCASQAVRRVPDVHTDETEAVARKISKQLTKATSAESFTGLPWHKAVKQFVDRAMQGYCASCGQSDWFYDLDLTATLANAAMEIVLASGEVPDPQGIWEICQMEFEDKLDRMMLEKALWEVMGNFFRDAKTQGKVFNAFAKSYWPALDEALEDGNLHKDILYGLDAQTDLKRVELFTKRWLDSATSRAWVAIEQSGDPFTEETLQEMLRQFIAPFGQNHPFSCLPGALTERLGRPPPDWAFIRPVVHELFCQWNRGGDGGPKKKKRKGGGGGDDWEVDYHMREVEQHWSQLQQAEPMVNRADDQWKDDGKTDRRQTWVPSEGTTRSDPRVQEGTDAPEARRQGPRGHPDCTSADDCIGTSGNRLVRHLHKGQPGDVYCELCWNSFRQRNSSLQGVFLNE